MFENVREAIVYSLKASRILLHRYVDDLKPEEFEHQPAAGMNCISWILGHLILTDRRMFLWLGGTEVSPLKEGFEDLFKTTRTKAAQQTGYGNPQELIRLFDEHRERLIEMVRSADVAKFSEPPSFQTPMFANKAEASLFMGLHTAMHMGQVSMIRRSLGYPPLA